MRVKSQFFVFIFGFMLLVFPPIAFSEDILLLEHVLESTHRHYPKIQEQYQKLRKAQAKLLKSQGSFDPKLSLEGRNTAGYYDNRSLNLKLEQSTPFLGLSVFGGWRVSDGEFPVYEGMFETTQSGEVYGGLKLPLLRDGMIDQERTDIAVSKLKLKEAETMLLMTRLEFSYQAAYYYWKWFSAGQKYKIYQKLLEIAEFRQRGIQAKITAGSNPEIDSIDNQQFIANRQALVVEAEEKFIESSIKLSLFYRDAQGEPMTPSLKLLPDLSLLGKALIQDSQDEDILESSLTFLENHPLLQVNRLKIEQAENKLRLAKNQILPKLDLSVKLAKDLNDGGDTKINTEEFKTELALKVPLLNRKARGEKKIADSELQQSKIQYKFLFEKLKNNLKNALQKKQRAMKRLHLTQRQWVLAKKVEDAERTKFNLGYSDLLSLNLREEYTAKARVNYLEALFNYQVSLAEYKLSIAKPQIN